MKKNLSNKINISKKNIFLSSFLKKELTKKKEKKQGEVIQVKLS